MEEEGTLSSFRGLDEPICGKGLFAAFCTDRDSHYSYTQKAGGKVDKQRLTQVGRVLSLSGGAGSIQALPWLLNRWRIGPKKNTCRVGPRGRPSIAV